MQSQGVWSTFSWERNLKRADGSQNPQLLLPEAASSAEAGGLWFSPKSLQSQASGQPVSAVLTNSALMRGPRTCLWFHVEEQSSLFLRPRCVTLAGFRARQELCNHH